MSAGLAMAEKMKPVKLRAGVFRKLEIICTAHGYTMAHYVSDKLEALLEKDLPEALRKLEAEGKSLLGEVPRKK